MYILSLYVTNASLNINHPFTYLSKEEVVKMSRVEVIFANRKSLAFVDDVKYTCKSKEEIEKEYGFKLSFINRIIDDKPLISKELYDLAFWLAKVTISPFITCLNTMLPKTMKTGINEYNVKKVIRIKKIELNDDIKLTKRQSEIFNLINDNDLYSDVLKLSPSIINKLISINLLKKYESEIKYEDNMIIKSSFKELTNDQFLVYDGILKSDKMTNLLFGVTGAGKTEVYLHLARHYLENNKEVLILVPEISLTPQMIKRVKERFDGVAFYHSNMNDQEKHIQYQRVLNNEIKIVVGTRSSIFLPFNNLGLIIIDEEHDHSYKQDNIPTYNVKNVAFYRAKYHQAKVVLASATPSLESFARANKGDYNLFRLDKRINNSMPNIEIVDMSKSIKTSNSYIISDILKDNLKEVLNNHKQAIILLNRRGYSPVIRCGDCHEVLMCKDCETSLNYHKDENILKCHICNKTYKMIKECPHCHSHNLLQYGFGTKKVVEVLNELFSDAKIERMDADSVNVKNGHQKILDRFENHQIDILVGTQMIAKGLDYPDVTLVGILNADAGLNREDYNSSEITFNLLMQASGRAGRASDPGKVIIQAFNSDHYVLKAIINKSYEYFYNIEMKYRQKAFYPPYSHMLCLYLKDNNLKRLAKSVEILDNLTSDLPFRKYRPMELNKIKGFNRYRILIKDKNLIDLLNKINEIILIYLKNKNVSSIKVDIDPMYLE